MKQTTRIAILLTITCAALAGFSSFAQAQRIDIAFGGGTTLAPSANSCSGDCEVPQSLSGGTFLGFSGDVLFWKNLGVGAEVNWRASQGGGTYLDQFGLNYRPVFYNFNAVYSPKLASHAYLELVGGIGGMSTHLYQCDNCGFSGGRQRSGQQHPLRRRLWWRPEAVCSPRSVHSSRGAGLLDQQRHQLFRQPRYPRRRLDRLYLQVIFFAQGQPKGGCPCGFRSCGKSRPFVPQPQKGQ